MFENMTYDEVRTDLLLGKITQAEWVDYCADLTKKMIVDNAELFIRMRDK